MHGALGQTRPTEFGWLKVVVNGRGLGHVGVGMHGALGQTRPTEFGWLKVVVNGRGLGHVGVGMHGALGQTRPAGLSTHDLAERRPPA